MVLLLMAGQSAVAASPHVRSFGFYQGNLATQVTGAPPTEVWSGGAQSTFTNNDPGEEEVTDAEAYAGSNSWRFSSGYPSSGQGTPFSPPLADGVIAGEPSLGATADVFEVSFWFKPVGQDASQYINVSAGNTGGTDRASNMLRLYNTSGGGATVTTFESVISSAWDSVEIVLTNDLDDSWHHVKMIGRFYDGCWNDTWTYAVNGKDLGTYNAYFEGARCNHGFSQELTNRLKIRPFFDDNSNNKGFYFDEIRYKAYRMAEPENVLASYYTGFEPRPRPGSVFIFQ